MNNDEVKRVIRSEAERVSGNFGVFGVAIIILALCLLVVGTCWAGAWMMVNLGGN